MMRTGQHLMLTLCACLTAMGFALCWGCTPQKAEVNDVQQHEALRTFLVDDSFKPPAGSVYPEPSVAPDQLLAFASQRYDSDCDVRRLIAYYFLRHDSALLDRGLITASADPGTLIELLWQKEAHGWAETPSAAMMRQHIAASTERFRLDSSGKELLKSNQAKFARMVQRWKDA